MQFLALIMINIMMFVIFYLIISLKLEKKATEFREKRMRRIMEEIINEFNETAERNISLLENKIQTMRRLLKLSGECASLDVLVGDNDIDTKKSTDKIQLAQKDSISVTNASHNENLSAANMFKAFIFEGSHAIAKKFNNFINNVRTKASHEKRNDTILPEDGKSHQKEAVSANCMNSRHLNGERDKKCDRIQLESDEEKIRLLFSYAHDKYALVSDLYGQGYSVEFISRCSGIPVGEVRLVLNLKSKNMSYSL